MSGKVDIQAIPASVMLCELINSGLYVSQHDIIGTNSCLSTATVPHCLGSDGQC